MTQLISRKNRGFDEKAVGTSLALPAEEDQFNGGKL
jgi:hypothetical protein